MKFVQTLLCCQIVALSLLTPLAYASGDHHHGAHDEHEEAAEAEKGPHGGQILHDGDFELEMVLVESIAGAEFRAYAFHDGQLLHPEAVSLSLELIRLTGHEQLAFTAEGDYLKTTTYIEEPHAFEVEVSARYQGHTHEWEFDHLEGRVTIHREMAEQMAIVTEPVAPQTLQQTLHVYGELVLPPSAKRRVSARFDGEIKRVYVTLGEQVKKGQRLFTVESNESLQPYHVVSPMAGTVDELFVGEGEHARGQPLLTLLDQTHLIAELAVFPLDVKKVAIGAPVSLNVAGFPSAFQAQIAGRKLGVTANQASTYRVSVPNASGALQAGQFVTAAIEIGQFAVPLAVKRSALQSHDGAAVVYARYGEIYEVRKLELGREAGEWVEVRSGITAGTEYVTQNSYIIKADIEKSGASHDH